MNIFTYIRALVKVRYEIGVQNKFNKRFLIPYMKTLEEKYNGVFPPPQVKKILQYYGLFIPSVLCASYKRLYGKKLTEEERKMAIKAAKAMGLNVAGVDMMRSDRGPLILEVNASPGFGIEKVTGRDVATSIIEYVELNAKRRNKKDKVGA